MQTFRACSCLMSPAKNFTPLVAGRPILARQPRPGVWQVHDPHSKGSGARVERLEVRKRPVADIDLQKTTLLSHQISLFLNTFPGMFEANRS
jgi:hypothetical protein